MSRELRISAAIPLPEDVFEQARKVADVEKAVTALQEALGVAVSTEVVKPVPGGRPRKAKEETAPPAAAVHAHTKAA